MSCNDNNSGERRRMAIRDAATIITLALAAAGIIWRGGQMTEQLATIGTSVTRIESGLDGAIKQQARDGADIRALQERDIAHGEVLRNHENRITRLEESRRRRE